MVLGIQTSFLFITYSSQLFVFSLNLPQVVYEPNSFLISSLRAWSDEVYPVTDIGNRISAVCNPCMKAPEAVHVSLP